MTYYVFTGDAPQNQTLRRLKDSLLAAKEAADRINAQNPNMTLAQMQAQFGVDASLTEVQWETLISNLVTALADAAITNITTALGFST